MKIGKMWPQKDLEELQNIFQDIEDIGYTCHLREVNQIFIYNPTTINRGTTDRFGIIDYDKIYDPLYESVDRLCDKYDVDIEFILSIPTGGSLGVYPGVEIQNDIRRRVTSSLELIKSYKNKIPDELNFNWSPNKNKSVSGSIESDMDLIHIKNWNHGSTKYELFQIVITTSPKKIFGKIKNFLGFNESLNTLDISDNIKDVFEDIGDSNTNIRVEFENDFKVTWDVGYSSYRSGKEVHSLNYVRIRIDGSEFEDCGTHSNVGGVTGVYGTETNKIFKKLETLFDEEISYRLDRLEDLYKIKTLDIGVEFLDRFALPLFYTISNNDNKHIKYAYVTRYRTAPWIPFNYVVLIFFDKF